jgi:hypothetical protein
MHKLKFAVLSWILLLAACGGGGGYTDDGGDGDGGDSTTTVARVILLADTTQLPSASDQADEGVTLSAQALNASGNLINSAVISFSIPPSSGALIVAADDGSGTRTATLTTAGDPTPRTITVTAVASGITTTLDIAVTGTKLELTGPESVGFGRTGDYVATLTDSDGNGIGGRAVSFSTSAGSVSAGSATTSGTTGSATTTLTGSVSGSVTAEALGLTATQTVSVTSDQFGILSPTASSNIPLNTSRTITVEWLRDGSPAETAGATVDLSASRGTVSPNTVTLDSNGQASTTITSANAGGAVIVASSSQLSKPTASVAVEFVATTAAAIAVQASPATLPINESSVISAIVRDPAGNLVKNKVVDFTLTDISGGTLSAASAVTNSQGKASVTYTASGVSSADKGVHIDATVHDTPSVTSFAELTVGGQALRITLGTGNEIEEPNATTYDQPYSVIVTDSSGNAVPDAEFRLSVLPVAYNKGYYELADTDGDGEADVWVPHITATCANEDLDYDGVLDPGEDYNNNGRLEPGNVASVPNSIALEDNGAGEFLIRYPQDRANWAIVELRGVAAAVGTETTTSAIFTLNVLADDVNDPDVSPPGPISPYGVAEDCENPN